MLQLYYVAIIFYAHLCNCYKSKIMTVKYDLWNLTDRYSIEGPRLGQARSAQNFISFSFISLLSKYILIIKYIL